MFRATVFTLSVAAHLLGVSGAPASEAAGLKGRFSLPVVQIEDDDMLPRAESANKNGTETATINVGSNWWIPVSLGTPPQSFLVLGDTGSPMTSFGSTLLPKDQQGSDPLFNPNKSSTAEQVAGETYQINFVGGGGSNGVVFQDTLKVGDLVLDNMYVGLATNHKSGDTGDSGRSGNLGLNFATGQSTSPDKEPTWLATIMPQLETGLFTFDADKSAGTGVWNFGFIDKSSYTGAIAYGPVNDKDGWRVEITHRSNSMNATVDTGTAGSRVTSAIAQSYFSNIKGATFNSSKSAWTYPCTSTLVDFNFSVGGTQVAIPAAALAAGSAGNGMCQTTLQVAADDANLIIWGRTFIQAMFVVFDWDNGRVGFANKN